DIEIREVADKDGRHHDEFFVIKEKKRLDGTFEPYSEGFVFQDVESAGTVKLLALAGPIIEALENGSLLMIDEMDQSFHTLMTRYVLELFRGEFNTNGAQLVFSTHDISNLRSELFRRDQIWFVEKRQEGNSALVSLVAFKFDEQERKNSFEFYQNYLNGKYGAVPFLPPADWWVDNGEA
ncbi:ATP/GTP-binding protein, partial [Jeotgalibaca porci]|uniref:AAA family ATPase n=1 Tax=Jeotgalibaca porci TaxID=1868793 RepID=UPI0035A0D6BE